MDNQQYIEYVQSDYSLATASMHQKKQFVTLGLSLLAIYPGVMMKGLYRLLSLSLIFCILTSIVFVVIYSKKLTLKKHLILNIIGDSEIVIACLINQITFAAILNDSRAILIVLLLCPPNIIIPILLIRRSIINLKNGKKRKFISVPCVALCVSCGGVGYLLSRQFLSHASQSSAIVLILVFFAILSYIFSTGLVAILKLYYYKVLEKKGVDFSSL